MRSLISKIAITIPKYIFLIFILLFSLSNIFFTARQYNNGPYMATYEFGFNFLNVVFLLLIGLVIWCLNKNNFFNISESKYLILFLAIVGISGLYWIFSNPRTFSSFDDSRNCFDAARSIINGDYAPLGYRSYINTYPHNLPLVTYFMLIIKIFGESNAITIIDLVNLVFVVLGYLHLYKITRIIFNNRRTNMNLITLMLLSMQFVFFAYYVYGNVMSITLSMISVFYLIKYINESKVKSILISISTICLGVAMKNNAMIVLVAEIIYLLLETIVKKKYICLFISVLMILGTVLCTNGVIKYWENKANYNYDNKLPKICWVAYGFNYDDKHPGSYFDSLERYHFENGYVVEYTENKAKEFISESLDAFSKRPELIIKLLAEKMMLAWTNPEYGVFQYEHLVVDESINNLNKGIIKGTGNKILNNIWDSTLTVVSTGLLIYIFKRRKEIELIELILAVIVIGGFFFHMVWELKSIYMYHYYLCLLPYAAHGLMLLFNKK